MYLSKQGCPLYFKPVAAQRALDQVVTTQAVMLAPVPTDALVQLVGNAAHRVATLLHFPLASAAMRRPRARGSAAHPKARAHITTSARQFCSRGPRATAGGGDCG